MLLALAALPTRATAAGQALNAETVPGEANNGKAVTRDKFAVGYQQLPLAFEVNAGQSDSRVKFICRGAGYTLFLTGGDTILTLAHTIGAARNPARNSESDILRFGLIGARSHLNVEGLEPLPGKSNYFIGNDPAHWHTSVPQYAKVKAAGVYPGIDLVYYGRQQQLEYDFQVAPGADSNAIRFTIQGASGISFGRHGDLVLNTAAGDITERAPVIYQLIDGKRAPVHGSYEIHSIDDGSNDSRGGKTFSVGFHIASYDHKRALIIDPVLVYSTYLGGSGSVGEVNYGLAIDGTGAAYVTGYTDSATFPTLAPFQSVIPGQVSAFVTKLNATGTQIVYSTYLGGNGDNYGNGIAVDPSGNAYVRGATGAANFPTTANGYQTALSGTSFNAFVTVFNAAGSALLYSSYLGQTGDVNNIDYGIVVDSASNAFVTGYTPSTTFPVTANAAQPVFTGTSTNAFVSKLNPNLTGSASLLYSTFLGGPGNTTGYDVVTDGAGRAYVTGVTTSSTFPITAGACQHTLKGATNSFVTILDTTASGTGSMVYSTYLGGNGSDTAEGIAVDANDDVYITGHTNSTIFPTTANAYQSINKAASGGFTAFMAKINPAASGSGAILYSTLLGGTGGDGANVIAVDSVGNAYIGGFTASSDFPIAPLTYQATLKGPANAFIAKISTTLSGASSLAFSTYLGGNGYEDTHGIVVTDTGDVFVSGWTTSTNFPFTLGAYQTSLAGSNDTNAFVAHLYIPNISYPLSLTATNGTITPNPNQGAYVAGSRVVLTASANAGYQFAGWGGSASGLADPLTITISGSTSVTANFTLVTYALGISGTGSDGTVTPNPGKASYLPGDQVVLTASASTGYVFTGWSGDASGNTNPLTVTMNGNKNITAVFSPLTYTIEISGSGGAVTIQPSQGPFDFNSQVVLFASPYPGYVFTGWGGDAAGNANPLTVTVTGDLQVVANFLPDAPSVFQGLFDGQPGFITITLGRNGEFTGSLLLDGLSHRFHGALDGSGGFAGAATPLLDVSFQLAAATGGSAAVIFTGSAGAAQWIAYPASYIKGQPVAETGKYTILLTATDTGAGIPQSPGFATLTVKKTGAVTVAGRLADGESFHAAGILTSGTDGNQVVIYEGLRYPFVTTTGAMGSLNGVLVFGTVPGGDIGGRLEWAKPEQTKGDYQPAITTDLNVTGSPYTFAKGDSVLPGFTNGTLELSDTGALGLSGTKETVMLTSGNAITVSNPGADKLKLKIKTATGLFSGSFLYPGQVKPTAFGGVLLQDGTSGAGFFLGPNGSGNVNLTSP